MRAPDPVAPAPSQAAPAATQAPPASADGAPPATLIVTSNVQQSIICYLEGTKAEGRFWALAIAKNGSQVFPTGCQRIGYYPCRSNSSGQMTQQATNELAIKKCGGSEACVVLYEKDRKVANLELVVQDTEDAPAAANPQQSAALESAALENAAPSTTSGTFAVSAAVKNEIDEYLAKAASGTGAWVLAVAKDGTAAAYVRCGGATNSAGCPHISSPSMAAQNAAIRNCGGPGKCIVLYEGTKKVVSGEIIVK